MRLKLSTRQYINTEKTIKGKTPGRLAAAAEKAIDSGRPSWEKTMTAILSVIIEDFGSEVAGDMGAEKSIETKWTFDPMSAAIRAWISKNGAASITSILATDLEDVKRVILSGVNENLSTPQIARNLRKFYTDRSPFKAMRVARTEVTKAASYGSQEAARQSGIIKTKTWLTSRDDRVRDSHAILEGETVKLDKNFSDGQEFPSEPMCRCVMTFGSGKR